MSNRQIGKIAFCITRLLAVLICLQAVSGHSGEFIWWEAENPKKANNMNTGGAFSPRNDEEKTRLSGGAWLNGNFQDGAFAEYDINVPEDGAYSLYIRRFWHHGPFRWRIDDGAWNEIDHDVNLLDEAELRKMVLVCWIRGGESKLTKGKHTFRLELKNNEKTRWKTAYGFDCFLLTDIPFTPSGLSKPGAKLGLTEPGCFAFEPEFDNFKPEAQFDLRSLNENVAGESGYVTTHDGKFFLGNGKEVRFWGIGLENHLMDTQSLDYLAREYSKRGVNLVRLFWHVFSGKDGGQLDGMDPELIDAYQRAVAAFKKQGIYVKICPYFALAMEIKKEWGIPGYPENWRLPFGVLMIDPKLQEGYRARVKKLFTAKSPYTGLTLAQDPAVAIVQVQNEDGLFFPTFYPDSMKKEQNDQLKRLFGSWLLKKYGTVDAVYAKWGTTPEAMNTYLSKNTRAEYNKRDDPDQGMFVVGGAFWMAGDQKEPRKCDQTEFLVELQTNFYTAMRDFYRKELGVKSLITASNWRAGWDANMHDMERATYRTCDVLDDHHYISPLHNNLKDPTRASWDLQQGDVFLPLSALKKPGSLPASLKQYSGMPSIISESTWSNPSPYAAEAPFLVSAYGCLGGLDGFCWFAVYKTGFQPDLRKFPVASPALLGQFPATALLYRKGYLQEGPQVVYEQRTLQDIRNKVMPVIGQSTGYDPGRDSGKGFSEKEASYEASPLSYMVGRVNWQVGAQASKEISPQLKTLIDVAKGQVQSATGEILLNWNTGFCTVNAPKAQGATGFLKQAGELKLKDLTIRCENEFATVLVVPLDDKPIAESSKLLVQAMTDGQPYGWKVEAADIEIKKGVTEKGFRILSKGQAPFNVKNITMRLTFQKAPKAAQALDGNGYPMTKSSAELKGNELTLPLDALYTIVTR